jgi:hypothetical protein
MDIAIILSGNVLEFNHGLHDATLSARLSIDHE